MRLRPLSSIITSRNAYRKAFVLFVGLFIAFALGATLYLSYLNVTLPNLLPIIQSAKMRPRHASQILAMDHSILMRYGISQERVLSLSEISPVFVNMFLLIKAPKLFSQLRARPYALRSLHPSGPLSEQGQSYPDDLAEALIQSLVFKGQASFSNWIRGRFLMGQLRAQLSPKEVIALYLNHANFGNGTYGIGAASQLYLNKTPLTLSTTDSALLIGLLMQPKPIDPFSQPGVAKSQRDEVLSTFARRNHLDSEILALLQSVPLFLNSEGPSEIWQNKAPELNQTVLSSVLNSLHMAPEGFWVQGLTVMTTINPRLQQLAMQQLALNNALNQKPPQNKAFSMLVLDNQARILASIHAEDVLNPLLPSSTLKLIQGIQNDTGQEILTKSGPEQSLNLNDALSQLRQYGEKQHPKSWFMASTPELTTAVWLNSPVDKTPVSPFQIYEDFISEVNYSPPLDEPSPMAGFHPTSIRPVSLNLPQTDSFKKMPQPPAMTAHPVRPRKQLVAYRPLKRRRSHRYRHHFYPGSDSRWKGLQAHLPEQSSMALRNDAKSQQLNANPVPQTNIVVPELPKAQTHKEWFLKRFWHRLHHTY